MSSVLQKEKSKIFTLLIFFFFFFNKVNTKFDFEILIIKKKKSQEKLGLKNCKINRIIFFFYFDFSFCSFVVFNFSIAVKKNC